MATYRLHRGATIASELRRIAAAQTDQALAQLDEQDPHDAIHDARKRCKKVRALLRLVRTANEELYERENVAYRDAARQISDLRDTTGAIEAFDLMARHHPEIVDSDRFTPIRDALLEERERAAARRLDAVVAGVGSDLRAARERIGDWDVPDDSFSALAGGLAKTYDRARDAMAEAYDSRTTEAFHQWRKRVKYHRYHLRLLQDCWRPLMKARRAEAHELSDLLGEDHDLSELRAHLHEHPERFGDTDLIGEFSALVDRRRARLQLDARWLGERLFVEPADDFVDRVGRYWDIWIGEPSARELLPDQAVGEYAPSPAG